MSTHHALTVGDESSLSTNGAGPRASVRHARVDPAAAIENGVTFEADQPSPYAATLQTLHRQRAVLELELQKVMTAIEGLEALDRTTRRRYALAGSSVMFQGLEFQARTTRAAAETVLRRIGTPLCGGELRKLIEKGGLTVTYRALYNMLKKRKSTFRQLADKRWTLVIPPDLGPS
jgi:hypothetical protein